MKRILFLILLLTLVFGFVGCGKRKDISFKKIDKYIFTEDKSFKVWINSEQLSKSRELSKHEISILRSAVKNGSDLKILPNKEMPNFLNCVIITIKWTDGYGGNLVYQRNNGYMFVYKDFVYRKKFKNIDKNPIKTAELLQGIYTFKPSKIISKIIPDSNNE